MCRLNSVLHCSELKIYKKCGRVIFSSENEVFFVLPLNKPRPFLDEDEEDNIVLAQLITPENDPYDNQVSAEDWNRLFDASDDEDD